MNKKVWRKYKTEITFGAIALVAVILSHGDIKRSMQSLGDERARIAANTQQQRRLEESQELAKSKAVVAEDRYKNGCTMVVAANSPRNLATLVEGETVLDRTTKKSLPSGTIVCDGNGSTGVLAPNADSSRGVAIGTPVVTDMAFTGNRDLALATLRKISGAKVYYFTPEK